MIRPWIHKQNKPWLADWSYRKSVTLSRASGAVTNYQIKLKVGESVGINIGSDLVTNGGFPSNTTGWSTNGSSIASVASGQSGNCLEVTRVSGNYQSVYSSASISVDINKKYTISCYIKSGTSGAENAQLLIWNDDLSYQMAASKTTTASWELLTLTFIPTSAPIHIGVVKSSGTAGTMLFDSITLYETRNQEIDCGGLCATDFDDIRFTKSDGTTVLDYWIESITGTTPNQVATIWIEFDSIGTGATTFYMYYGNSGAAAYSSGANTFPLFDDFDGASVDADRWNIGGTPTVASSILTITGTNDENISSKTTFGTTYAFRTHTSISENGTNGGGNIGFPLQNAVHWGGGGTLAFDTYKIDWSSGTSTVLGLTYTPEYHIFEIQRNSTTNIRLLIDDVSRALHTTNFTSADSSVTFYLSKAAATQLSSWCLVRQFLATEPAWGAWGTQES